MNPLEFLWVVFQWLFVLMCIIGAAILLFALLVAGVGGIKKWFKPKHKATRERFDRERQAIALDMFRHNQIPAEPVDAFKAGAEWSRGFHTR